MDDGGRSNYNKDRPEVRGVTINSHGFARAEVASLVMGLRISFRLDCWIGKNKSRWVIIISGRSYPHLLRLIDPYLHPSMLYKFPLADLTSGDDRDGGDLSGDPLPSNVPCDSKDGGAD
jgi:hypothetical protein